MTQRALYIAAYDVSGPGRLRDALKVLKVLKRYTSVWQKSGHDTDMETLDTEKHP